MQKVHCNINLNAPIDIVLFLRSFHSKKVLFHPSPHGTLFAIDY
jgi:hypothetical protein